MRSRQGNLTWGRRRVPILCCGTWLIAGVFLAAVPRNAFAQLDIPRLVRSFQHEDFLTFDEVRARTQLAEQIRASDSAVVSAAVPSLLVALEDPDPPIRAGAARVLALLGPAGRPAVPALIRALRDSFPPLRSEAAHALARIGSAKTVVPPMSALLQDSGAVSIQVAMTLESMRSKAVEAVPALAEALRVGHLRWSAARVLAAIGPGAEEAMPALREAWDDEERDHVRLAIFYAIRAIRPTLADSLTGIDVPVTPPRFSLDGVPPSEQRTEDSTINAYIDRLRDPDPNVRVSGVRGMVWFLGGAHDERRAPVMAQVLAASAPDEDERVRVEIVTALRRIPRNGGPLVLHTLMWALRDPAPAVRQSAAWAMRTFRSRAVSTVPELLALVQGDPDPTMRQAALGSITLIYRGNYRRELRSQHAEVLFPILTAAAGDPEPAVQSAAVQAIFAVDRDLGVLTLRDAVESPDSSMRVMAVRALNGYDPIHIPEAVSILRRAMEDENAVVRAFALRIVGLSHDQSTGEPRPNESLVVSVGERLRDDDVLVRRRAAEVLGKFRRSALPALPALTQALRDSIGDVVERAAVALGHLGPDAAPAVPALIDALQVPEAQANAADALGRIGPAAAPAVPALMQALQVLDVRAVRENAAEALGRIGPAAAAAVDALRALARDDSSPMVQSAATRALSRILRQQ